MFLAYPQLAHPELPTVSSYLEIAAQENRPHIPGKFPPQEYPGKKPWPCPNQILPGCWSRLSWQKGFHFYFPCFILNNAPSTTYDLKKKLPIKFMIDMDELLTFNFNTDVDNQYVE